MALIKLNGIKHAEAAMEKAGLAWDVEQVGIMTENGLNIDSHKALFRSDNHRILGIVGSEYEVIQNSTAFAFFDVIAERHDSTYEYAGIIKEGRKIFLQAKLGRSFDAVPGDRVDCYVTLVTSHDGSSSLRAFLTPIRLFCENQLIRAIRSATTNVVLRHTSSVNDRLKEALQVFRITMDGFAIFKEKAQYLARKMVDKRMVERFLDAVVEDTGSTRSRNQRQKINELFEHGRGNTGKSSWHLYNAATEFVDHERTSDPEKALDSRMFGSGALLKERAFAAAIAL